jgi:hypothetical protein
VLTGGSGWTASASATPAGGRWLESRTDKARNGLSVAAVQVVDFAGVVHDVQVQPALVVDRCR